MPDIFLAYAVTFGWIIVSSLAMGLGIAVVVKLFTLSTPDLDEWELVRQGNIPVAIILASMILALGIVVGSAVHAKIDGKDLLPKPAERSLR